MDRMGMFQMPPLVAPQLTNQPPQIFGSYLADGLPQLTPDMAAQLFPDSSMLLDDSLDAKRRRIARVSLSICLPERCLISVLRWLSTLPRI